MIRKQEMFEEALKDCFIKYGYCWGMNKNGHRQPWTDPSQPLLITVTTEWCLNSVSRKMVLRGTPPGELLKIWLGQL